MQILHLSDLHIVTPETLKLIASFNRSLGDLPFRLEVHPSSENGRQLLSDHLRKQYAKGFDAIVVTGDLTGLGDDPSLSLASDYLEQLALLTLKDPCLKNVLVIPGNHDVLEHTLTAFVGTTEQHLGLGANLLLRFFGGHFSSISRELKRFLSALRPAGAFALNAEDIEKMRDYLLAGFNTRLYKFTVAEIGQPTSFVIAGHAQDGRPLKLRFSLINTLTFMPLLFSSGMITEIQAAQLVHSLQHADGGLDVALTHQGLLPLPKAFQTGLTGPNDIAGIFEHSFASLINGYNLARVLQSKNVELHIHGHEHHHTASSFDFELDKAGALFSFGSAASGQMEAGAEFGFSVLRFDTPTIAKLEPYLYRSAKAAFEAEKPHYVKFGDLVSERITRIARSELHRIFYTEPVTRSTMSKDSYIRACDDLFENSPHCLLYFGVQLRSVRRAITKILYEGAGPRRERIKKRIERGVSFLITESTELYPSKTHHDIKNNYVVVAREWSNFLDEVAELLATDRSVIGELIQIKTTSAPLSYGGIIEYSLEGEQIRFHKALVQTIMFQQLVDSELYFEVRDNVTSGFLNYFAGTAFNLWKRQSKPIKFARKRVVKDGKPS